MHSISHATDPWVLLHYYYMVASFALIMRVFFQLFVNKEAVTKTDFVLSIFWPVMIWLVPVKFIRDIAKICSLGEDSVNNTKV